MKFYSYFIVNKGEYNPMKLLKTKSNLFAIVSILMWCFSGICFRKGAEILKPMTYLALITGIGSLTACLIHILNKKKLSLLFNLPVKVKITGFFGITVYTIFLATAFSIAKPDEIGLINLLNYLWPLWMVILEIIILKDKPKKILFLTGILLGLMGLLFSSNFNFSFNTSTNFLPHVLALSGGFLWALYSVLLKKWKISDDQSGTVFHFAICALISFILAFFTGEWGLISTWTNEATFWVIFGGIGPVGIAYYLWELGVKKGSIGVIASLSYFIPIGSSILIGMVFVESMKIGLIPGSIMITLGALFVNKAIRNSSGNKENFNLTV